VGDVSGPPPLDRRHADPVFFLGYWGNDAARPKKYLGDWCRTGDQAADG
jgi:acyl-coenzyme A synthetase/AMP-(fatty) acid ligase